MLTIGLFTAASVLSDSFVNIYLWRLKSDYIPIAVYLLSCYATVPVIFYLCGYIGMRIDRVSLYITGIFFYVAFYSMVLLFKENITSQVILWGFVKGLAMGFFYFGYHVLTFDFTGTHNRDRFYATTTIISSSCAPLGLLAGFIIIRLKNFHGYYIIFACSAVLFLAAAWLSLSMRSTPIKKAYKIEDLIFTTDRRWLNSMLAFLFLSGKDTVSSFLIGILVYKSTGSEMSIGLYSLLISSAVIATSSVMSRFSRPETREKYVLAGAFIAVTVALLLIWRINFVTLLIFGLIGSIGDAFIRIPINAHTLDIISLDANANERKMEYIVARDVPIAVGRIVMIVVFVMFLQYMPVNAIKAIIMVISAFPFGVYYFLYRNKG